MNVDQLIARAGKLLKYEDDLANLPTILVLLLAAVVRLAKANGFDEQQLHNAVDDLWNDRR